ncbi:DUF1059 domain-containing protein [Amycolatopsis acidicola]|uniref:DUF1059 domain-containing protein n=1 Tax=Amycolatopsis acidicola TaxID=2596893 RepID=UPI00140E05EE|nr:hypothetical protein [Amycolatopsis acidicola]
MSYVINCECGTEVRGENTEEVADNAERHVEADHPELVGKISRDELLARARQG